MLKPDVFILAISSKVAIAETIMPPIIARFQSIVRFLLDCIAMNAAKKHKVAQRTGLKKVMTANAKDIEPFEYKA